MGYVKERRPRRTPDTSRITGVSLTTSVSTSLEPRGVYALQTSATSSEAPVVYTLQNPKPGDVLEMVALTLVSSSVAPFHVNSPAIFSHATASTGHDMVSLSTQGASFRAIARTSSAWLVTAVRGATFSTST